MLLQLRHQWKQKISIRLHNRNQNSTSRKVSGNIYNKCNIKIWVSMLLVETIQ